LFDLIANEFESGCTVFTGQPRKDEMIPSGQLKIALYVQAKNIHLFSGKYYLCWQIGIIKWLHTFQPDVVILEANPRYLHLPAAIKRLIRSRRKVIGWGLGAPHKSGFFGKLSRIVRTNLINKFDALITYSQKGAEEYIALGFPAQKIFIAPNAVMPKPSCPHRERQKFFQNGKPTLLFVGRLQSRKKVDLLIRACAMLPDNLKPRLWIVGEGPAKNELEKLARRLYPAVEFLGGIYGDDLEKYFMDTDLFVLPGTGGLAVQQAMSYSLPVIVGEADGTQVDLVKKNNGWILPPGNLDSLVDTLEKALTDPAHLREMGLESHRIICEEVNLEKMVAVFKQAVLSVMEKET